MSPCFAKVPLKKGCQLIATIDMMFSTIALVDMIWATCLYAAASLQYEQSKKSENEWTRELDKAIGFFGLVILIMCIATIFFFVLSILLYIASIQESIVKLRVWVGLNFIFMILSIFTFNPLLIIILVVYKVYSIWVVMSLVGEIRDGTQNLNVNSNGIVHSAGAGKNSFEV